jgi:hypothetical protein
MTSVERGLLGLLLVLLAVGGAGWFGYNKGYDHGERDKAAEWDQAVKDAELVKAETRLAGWEKADKLESDLNVLKGKYNVVLSQRKKANNSPVTCPASGVIGDVVVPVAAVRSMFNIPDPSTGDAAGPAPAQSASAVR